MLLADPLLAWSAPPPHADDGWNPMRLEALASFATVGSPEPAGGSLLSVSRDSDLDLSASRSLGDLEDVVFPPLSPDPVMDGSPLSMFTVSLSEALLPEVEASPAALVSPASSGSLAQLCSGSVAGAPSPVACSLLADADVASREVEAFRARVRHVPSLVLARP